MSPSVSWGGAAGAGPEGTVLRRQAAAEPGSAGREPLPASEARLAR
jgi:hypothetical protein